jgi:hypothetical protein
METPIYTQCRRNTISSFIILTRNYHKPCPCLGNLTDALHISPQTDNPLVKIILGYLLIGSYTTLFWLWWQIRKSPLSTPSMESTGSTA